MIRPKAEFHFNLKTWLTIAWIFFTVSMMGWWLFFSLKQLRIASELDNGVPLRQGSREVRLAEHHRQYRMLVWEGAVFLSAILAGGVALLMYIGRDESRHAQIRVFFSSFTHDIKTSIARLRLQADVLRENSQFHHNPVLNRLTSDISLLDLQLENSLFLSSPLDQSLLTEEIRLSEALESLRDNWENLELNLVRDAVVVGDRRAFASVLRNILQNSVMHGRAKMINITPRESRATQLVISFRDDGKGFTGDWKKLGKKQNLSEIGSGVGLYLTRLLVERMRGSIRFVQPDGPGFLTEIELSGKLVL